MMEITRITNIDNNKHIALLDTSSIYAGIRGKRDTIR